MLLAIEPRYRESNDKIHELSQASDVAFGSSNFFGDNQEVFKYQILTDDQGRKILRLYFYGNAKITVIVQ
jgi:hypothetical protein